MAYPRICSSYHRSLFCDATGLSVVDSLLHFIVSKELEFDCIACRGVSGVIPAAVVAWKLNKRLLVVRKEEERRDSHASSLLEGWLAPSYIIIDDFVSMGGTIRAITAAIEEAHRGYNLPSPDFRLILVYERERNELTNCSGIPIVVA